MKSKIIIIGIFALLLSPVLHGQILIPEWKTPPKAEQIIRHEGFTVSYNSVTKCPNWVSWDLTPEEASSEVTGRTGVFATDPLAEGPQAEDSDYTRNKYGLDRGHMAPSADFKWSRTANEQTFWLTNVCPQDHTLNEGLWLELEQRCRAYAKRYKTTLQIVCGPIHEKVPNSIGKNLVYVPVAFFKVVSMTVKGKPYGIAFIFPNSPLSVNDNIFMYAVELEEIERQTGLDLSWMKGKEKQNENPWDIPWKKAKSVHR